MLTNVENNLGNSIIGITQLLDTLLSQEQGFSP